MFLVTGLVILVSGRKEADFRGHGKATGAAPRQSLWLSSGAGRLGGGRLGGALGARGGGPTFLGRVTSNLLTTVPDPCCFFRLFLIPHP